MKTLNNNLLTIGECSSYLRLSTRTVYRMIHKGQIPYFRINKEFRFNKLLIDKYFGVDNDVRAKQNTDQTTLR